MKTAAVALISMLAACAAELPSANQANRRRAAMVVGTRLPNSEKQYSILGGTGDGGVLSGKETVPGGDTYEFTLTPKVDEKYLTRGRVWIDAQDYAVI
jgi:hypothetical protein